MAEDFDATAIYRAIQNRASEARRLPESKQMLRSLEEFLSAPSWANFHAYEAAEQAWRRTRDRGKLRDYSHDLKKALRRGDRITYGRTHINSPHNKDFGAPFGYVYGMTAKSAAYQGLIKLGVTLRKRHPQDRRLRLLEKYPQVEDLTIVFLCEISEPHRAELAWANELSCYRASLSNHESREWYRLPPASAYSKVQGIVRKLGLREFDKWYAHKTLVLNPPPAGERAPISPYAKTLPFVHGERRDPAGTLASKYGGAKS